MKVTEKVKVPRKNTKDPPYCYYKILGLCENCETHHPINIYYGSETLLNWNTELGTWRKPPSAYAMRIQARQQLCPVGPGELADCPDL